MQASNLSAAAETDTSLVAAPGAGKQIKVLGGDVSSLANNIISLSSGVIAGVKEVFSVDRGTSTGGTFTLTVDGQTTSATAFDAAAATVETNVEALSTVTTATVTGTGTAGDPWIVTIDTPLAGGWVVSGDGSSLTGGDATLTVTETRVGRAVAQGLRKRIWAFAAGSSGVSFGGFTCLDNEPLLYTTTATTDTHVSVEYRIQSTADQSA